MGAYGNPYVQTPHVDSIAANGVRFERSFCAALTEVGLNMRDVDTPFLWTDRGRSFCSSTTNRPASPLTAGRARIRRLELIM